MGLRPLASGLRGKKVLITGNTGFKGTWLQRLLQMTGAEVSGLSLEPRASESHWQALAFEAPQYFVDVRDAEGVHRAMRTVRPDAIFHLAAQSLVRESYKHPLATWQTNVIGTANVLEACRRLDRSCAVVVVTSDKCYENRGDGVPFRESDPLGGHDPYSASKAATELVAKSYQDSFFTRESGILVATARAGNVVGGGDWSEDRLIPDAMRALFSDSSLEIRYPEATRPWQHVLESLAGYLKVCDRLLQQDRSAASSWNFGPGDDAQRRVSDVLQSLQQLLPQLRWHLCQEAQPHEAALLALDSSRARTHLDWQPRWNFDVTMTKVAEWYQHWQRHAEAITEVQIAEYLRV